MIRSAFAKFAAGSLLIWGLTMAGLMASVYSVPRAKAQNAGMSPYCNQIANAVGVTTKQQIVAPAPAGNASILVCGYVISNILAGTVSFQSGTGTNCATNSAAVGPTIQFGSATGGITNDENVQYRGFRVANPGALCMTATVSTNVTIYYSYGN